MCTPSDLYVISNVFTRNKQQNHYSISYQIQVIFAKKQQDLISPISASAKATQSCPRCLFLYRNIETYWALNNLYVELIHYLLYWSSRFLCSHATCSLQEILSNMLTLLDVWKYFKMHWLRITENQCMLLLRAITGKLWNVNDAWMCLY